MLDKRRELLPIFPAEQLSAVKLQTPNLPTDFQMVNSRTLDRKAQGEPISPKNSDILEPHILT